MLLITRYTFLGTERKLRNEKKSSMRSGFMLQDGVFFFNFVAVIALPFLYVNMYLNLLYIDVLRYDVIASIANCFGLNIAFLGSFSNNRSAISTLYFGGHELDSNFRYIHFILFALYFAFAYIFIHTVNRLKEQPQPYKYTFAHNRFGINFLWMYATHRLSMYFSIFEK